MSTRWPDLSAYLSGENTWVALGNFMNEWFDYARNHCQQIVADPLALPEMPDTYTLRLAAFCVASVEWLCEQYGVSCPSWVHIDAYCLPEPQFDSPGAHKPQVRERLRQQIPEPFTRRNIFCGNRMFANKYEFTQHYQQFATTNSPATPTPS